MMTAPNHRDGQQIKQQQLNQVYEERIPSMPCEMALSCQSGGPVIAADADGSSTLPREPCNSECNTNMTHGSNHRHHRRRTTHRHRRQQHPLHLTPFSATALVLALTSPSSFMIPSSFVPVAVVSAVDAECPSNTNGWAASGDCIQYFWCSSGSRSSITYDCIQGTIYNVNIAQCVSPSSYECPGSMTTTSTTTVPPPPSNGVAAGGSDNGVGAGAGAGVDHGKGSGAVPTPNPIIGGPTAYPTKLGRPIYYGDFRTASCQSSLSFDQTPDWIAPEDMFSSKEDCCNSMFSWAPLENCLGPGFVETNYMIGSREPTSSPTWSPTSLPSMAPTLSSMPSSSPSLAPSVSMAPSDSPSEKPSLSLSPTVPPSGLPSVPPSDAPSLTPSTPSPTTTSPTASMVPTYTTREPTEGPTLKPVDMMMQAGDAGGVIPGTADEYGSNPRPTSSSSSSSNSQKNNNNDNFLVQLLGWTNSELTVLSHPTPAPTPVPTESNNNMMTFNSDQLGIAQVILPIYEDATVSKQRTTLNFGTNSAMAVSAGSTNTEGFDSLLKFDVQMIDSSRPIERATLMIRGVADCQMGGTFTTTSSSSWESNSVTWDNAPMNDGYIIGTLGEITQGTWYELDMTAALQWNEALREFNSGNYLSIRITTSDTARCMYSSKESGENTAPYLEVGYKIVDPPPSTTNQQPQQQNQGQQYNNGLVTNMSSMSSPADNPQGSDKVPSGQFILLKATDDSTINPKATDADSALKAAHDVLLKNAFDISNFLVLDFVIRFDLTEMRKTLPRTAVLTLYAEETCTSAGTFVTTSDNGDWNESTISWSTAPVYKGGMGTQGGTEIGTFGGVTKDNWYGFDVVQALADAVHAGKSAITFRVSSGNSGVCQFSSRESGRDPKLMIAF